jgi:homoserine kinase
VRIEPPANLEVLVVIPEYELSTKHARSVLPKEVPLQDAVFNLSHSSVLVAALSSGRLELISEAMRDRLHQPYRASLVPGMAHILEHATEHGALGVALSGAGPTLLALVDANRGQKEDLEAFMVDTLRASDIPAKTMWLKPEGQGVALLTPDDKSCTFIEKLKGELQA